jgi:hypothetical protein
MKRTVVQRVLNLAYLSPPPRLSFTDQFAFSPYGSLSAAIIFFLNTVTNQLLINPHVIVISLDFSKTFDTVQHTMPFPLMDELAKIDLSD